ncbi:MAG: hypothetical protein EHM20_09720 [Alphaproteobacteria bacterium]|nr:MAG: hypothetical protein EHM20_09720 [Alphaproteobacteria bacterium]
MKFEYSDFYKFIASVGIALISLAVLVPWLFFREPFDLLLKTEDITNLTPLAQSIIQNRQTILQIVINIIPWFSLGSLILGLITFVIGGINWFNRTQRIMDKMSELNLAILERQLASQSTTEVIAQKEEEAKAQVEEHIVTTEEETVLEPDIINTIVQGAYRVEKQLADKLKMCFAKTHDVLTERRLGAASYDIVLVSKNNRAEDYIFEVKYIRQGFKYNWLRDNVLKTVYASQLYEVKAKRESLPVLVVIGSESMFGTTKIGYQKRIQEELASTEIRALVIFLTEQELEELDCIKLNNILKT